MIERDCTTLLLLWTIARYHVTYTQITIGSLKFFGLQLFAKQNAEAGEEEEGGGGGKEVGGGEVGEEGEEEGGEEEGEELFEQEMWCWQIVGGQTECAQNANRKSALQL